MQESYDVKLLFLGLMFVLVEFEILAVGSAQLVPPAERRSIIADEVVMVEVVKPCAGVAWYKIHRVEEWNVIAAVYINGLHQADEDPRPHQHEMTCHRKNAKKESKPKHCKNIHTTTL